MSAYDEDYGGGDGGGGAYEEMIKEDKDNTEPLITKEEAPPKSPKPQSAVSCCCLLWSFIWFAVLFAFAWPFSVAMAAIYGFVSPMIALLGLEDISDSMLQAVHVGRECALNVRNGRPMF